MALPYAERAAFHEILMNSMEDVLLADAPWQRTAQDRGWIDDAICVTDEEAVAMSRYLVYHEGKLLISKIYFYTYLLYRFICW
jgi:hypothetical protein